MDRRMNKKKRMGRPPAKWAYDLAKLKHQDDKRLSLTTLSEITGASIGSLRIFLNKSETPKEYELEGGQARALYRVKDIKKSARDHIEPWL